MSQMRANRLNEVRPNRLPVREQQARSFEVRRKVLALRRLAFVVTAGLACAGSLAAWKTGAAEHWWTIAQGWMPEEQGLRGMQLENVRVVGAERMDPAEVTQVAGLAEGMPLMAIDLQTLRKSVEAIGWVKDARIRRMFPDTILIEIAERDPYALWQLGGALSVVDRTGAVITSEGIENYAHLPLVVGRGAAEQAAALEELLATQPLIQSRVRAAVRVGDRRWDIHLHNGVRIKLPEKNPVEALRRLAAAERSQGLLSRGVELVDLRLPDRLTIRLTPEAQERRASLEDNT